MRLKIFFEPKKKHYFLPINYQYQLSSAIYKIFKNGSNEVANWLHNAGYKDEQGRTLKLFNFSNLHFERYTIEKNLIKCFGVTTLVFSSPLETNLVKFFIDGIFKEPIVKIKYQSETLNFHITTIELQEELKPDNLMRYKLLTPASVSIQSNTNGVKSIKYLNPNDQDFAIRLINNLKKKFKILNGNENAEDISIWIKPENVKSKLITIKEGTPQEIKVKAYLFDFQMQAQPEIHQIAYYCGIGEKNSLGFGMIEKK